MAKNRIVKVGILALGRSGWGIHCRWLDTLRDRYQIVAVTDVDPARRQETAQRFGCRDYPDLDGVLKDPHVELVVNATPSHLHAQYAIRALRAGKDVVSEKPMATSLKEADAMIRAARRSGRMLAIFQNRRFEPDLQVVRDVIASGVLGRIVHIRLTGHSFGRRWDWQTLQRFGGGELNNNTPHLMDQALALFGPKRPNVFCLRDRTLTLGDADDHVKIVLSAKGAPTVEVELTRACPYPQEGWLIMATRGGLTGSAKRLRWKYFDPKALPARKVDIRPTPDRSYNKEGIAWIEKEWVLPEGADNSQRTFYIELYKTITRGAPLVVTPEQVRRQMWVFDQCREQAPV